MKYLEEQLNIKEMSDWYNVNFTEISQHGGNRLIEQYKTLTELFKSIYPEYIWDMYKFDRVPYRYYNLLNESVSHQQEFVNYLEKKFNIKKTSDWYLITFDRLSEIISINLSDAMKIVKKYYNDLDMNYFTFGNSLKTKKSQYLLKSFLQDLFPQQEIIEEYRHSDLDNLELDYYLPNLKLAFEYQVITIIKILINK